MMLMVNLNDLHKVLVPCGWGFARFLSASQGAKNRRKDKGHWNIAYGSEKTVPHSATSPVMLETAMR